MLIDDETRLKRCKALKILGEVFISHGGSLSAGLSDIKTQLNPNLQKETFPAKGDYKSDSNFEDVDQTNQTNNNKSNLDTSSKRNDID